MINSVNIKDNERFIEIGLLVNDNFNKCIKLVLDAIRNWANVYYLIIKKLYVVVLINNT